MDLFGIGSMVGSAINAAANISMNERNAELQNELLNRQQGFTRHERKESESYQTSEREAAQQYNLDMWNLNNEYNSPAEQAERLSAAGINPAAVFGSNGSVVASSPVQTSPQSGVQGEVVNAPQPAQQFNIGAGINDTIRALSEAALNSENAETVKETRDSLVEGLEQDIQYKKQQNALMNTFGYLERSAALKKTQEEANLALKQSIKYEKDANYTDALTETEKAHKLMMDALGRKSGYEADIAKKELDNWLEFRQAELRKLKSETQSNLSMASLNRINARRVAQLMPSEVEFSKMSAAEKSTAFLEAFQEYCKHKLTPEQIEVANKVIVNEIESNDLSGTGQLYNPVTYFSWLIHPLAKEINVALGASANAGATKMLKK